MAYITGFKKSDGTSYNVRDSNTYTIEESNKLFDKKSDKKDTYTKTEVYTKVESDGLLNKKSDKDNTYTKNDVDNLLKDKTNNGVSYTKTETNNLLDKKSDKEDTYGKIEVNNLLSTKYDKEEVYTKEETLENIESRINKILDNVDNNNNTLSKLATNINNNKESINHINDELSKKYVKPEDGINSSDIHQDLLNVINNKITAMNIEPGTFSKVTINNNGIVTSGSNPTTVEELGITNAITKEDIKEYSKIEDSLDVINENSKIPINSKALISKLNEFSRISLSEVSDANLAIPKEINKIETFHCSTKVNLPMDSRVNYWKLESSVKEIDEKYYGIQIANGFLDNNNVQYVRNYVGESLNELTFSNWEKFITLTDLLNYTEIGIKESNDANSCIPNDDNKTSIYYCYGYNTPNTEYQWIIHSTTKDNITTQIAYSRNDRSSVAHRFGVYDKENLTVNWLDWETVATNIEIDKIYKKFLNYTETENTLDELNFDSKVPINSKSIANMTSKDFHTEGQWKGASGCRNVYICTTDSDNLNKEIELLTDKPEINKIYTVGFIHGCIYEDEIISEEENLDEESQKEPTLNGYPIKALCGNGIVRNITSHKVYGKNLFWSENTFIDVYFNGNAFIIIGNPLLSKSYSNEDNFEIYADGQVHLWMKNEQTIATAKSIEFVYPVVFNEYISKFNKTSRQYDSTKLIYSGLSGSVFADIVSLELDKAVMQCIYTKSVGLELWGY